MNISWLGESCTRFHVFSATQNRDLFILFDPYRESSSGGKLGKVSADIVVVSDPTSALHNASSSVRGREENKAPFVINAPGEYEVSGVIIYGIPAENQKAAPPRPVTLINAEAEGMFIMSLGGFGQPKLTDAQLESFEHIDILTVPLGQHNGLSSADAAAIVGQIEPRIVIPLPCSGASSGKKQNEALIAQFAKELGLAPEAPVAKCKIVKKELPTEETRMIVLSSE